MGIEPKHEEEELINNKFDATNKKQKQKGSQQNVPRVKISQYFYRNQYYPMKINHTPTEKGEELRRSTRGLKKEITRTHNTEIGKRGLQITTKLMIAARETQKSWKFLRISLNLILGFFSFPPFRWIEEEEKDMGWM